MPRRSRKPMLFLSPTEVRRLADEIPSEHRTLIWTLAYTGIREGEATALRRRRVNPLLRELVIAQSATDVHGRKVSPQPRTTRCEQWPFRAFSVKCSMLISTRL